MQRKLHTEQNWSVVLNYEVNMQRKLHTKQNWSVVLNYEVNMQRKLHTKQNWKFIELWGQHAKKASYQTTEALYWTMRSTCKESIISNRTEAFIEQWGQHAKKASYQTELKRLLNNEVNIFLFRRTANVERKQCWLISMLFQLTNAKITTLSNHSECSGYSAQKRSVVIGRSPRFRSEFFIKVKLIAIKFSGMWLCLHSLSPQQNFSSNHWVQHFAPNELSLTRYL